MIALNPLAAASRIAIPLLLAIIWAPILSARQQDPKTIALQLEKNLKEYIANLQGNERKRFEMSRKKMEEATVGVIVGDETRRWAGATGVLVQWQGKTCLLSAGHNFTHDGTVIDSPERRVIRLQTGQTYAIEVVKTIAATNHDSFYPHLLNDAAPVDLAVARIDGLPGNIRGVELAESVKEGEKAFLSGYVVNWGRKQGCAIGDLGSRYPEKEKKLTALTKIGVIKKNLDSHFVFTPTGNGRVVATKGSSGGPVFNSAGELIGIFSAGYPKGSDPDCGGANLGAIGDFLRQALPEQPKGGH